MSVKSGEEFVKSQPQLFTTINISHTTAYTTNVKSEECF